MEQHPEEHEREINLNKDDSRFSGGFDCNICLDSVQDPVVTLCGHLYCWPCIYKWIHNQNSPSEKKKPRCPVCSCDVSENKIVPLYGRGHAANNNATEEKSSDLKGGIPPRPPTPRYGLTGTRDSSISRRAFQQQAPPPLVMPVRGSVDITTPISPSPTMGMLGEMVSGRIFGDLESPLFATPNSYSLAGVSTRRARRRATEADRSLSRIYTFLFCCIILCLLLFT
ncbi:E3 ubiquitin-protein ligase RMA1H1-like [Bidens hawaiensis]|uniref:E3 ubiquitin-protein ligase RMA1H1-like n=1 Tax=Bidens hawaiensis TaxID=980011 RepID=UPI004049A7E8